MLFHVLMTMVMVGRRDTNQPNGGKGGTESFEQYHEILMCNGRIHASVLSVKDRKLTAASTH